MKNKVKLHIDQSQFIVELKTSQFICRSQWANGLPGTALIADKPTDLFLDQCGSYIWGYFMIMNIHKQLGCLHDYVDRKMVNFFKIKKHAT